MIKKLLLVDDDEDMNFLHKMLIEKSGVVKELIIKKNGVDALSYLSSLKEKYPEVILLDINMPKMDGWQTANSFTENKESFKSSKVYILTSSINPDDLQKANDHIMIEGLIEKYLSIEKLQLIIDQI